VNNNGIHDEPEVGIRHVLIRLEGPVSRTLQTNIDGTYRFDGLPRGTYIVRQAQPANFIDGFDTAGTGGEGAAGSDQFQAIRLTSDTHAQGYNFGERGLKNPNKKLSLASTSLDWEILQPKLADESLDALWVQQMGAPKTIFSTQNPRNALDVSGDGFISPVDALMVINQLNAGSVSATPQAAPLFTAAAVPSGPFLDTSGDGLVSPLDSLLVINYLNAGFDRDAEGEASLAAAASRADASDAWLELLAADVDTARRKQRMSP
jgi:hypothetical protein